MARAENSVAAAVRQSGSTKPAWKVAAPEEFDAPFKGESNSRLDVASRAGETKTVGGFVGG